MYVREEGGSPEGWELVQRKAERGKWAMVGMKVPLLDLSHTDKTV